MNLQSYKEPGVYTARLETVGKNGESVALKQRLKKTPTGNYFHC